MLLMDMDNVRQGDPRVRERIKGTRSGESILGIQERNGKVRRELDFA